VNMRSSRFSRGVVDGEPPCFSVTDHGATNPANPGKAPPCFPGATLLESWESRER
jgi:hypothetical protein